MEHGLTTGPDGVLGLPRASWGRPSIVAIVFASTAAAVLFLRRPDVFLSPAFVAEDGQVLYVGTFFGDWVSQLLRPYNGYLLVLHHAVAWAGRIAPVAWSPSVFAFAANAIVIAAASYVGMRATFIPGRWLLAAFMVLLPAAGETIGVLSTVQFHLAIVLLVGILAAQPKSTLSTLAEALGLLLVALSGPFAIVLVPLLIARDWRDPRVLAVFFGGFVQLVVLLTTGRIPVGTDMDVLDRLSFVLSHGVVEPVIGMNLTASILSVDWLLGPMGIFIIALVTMTIRVRSWPWLYLWVATIFLAAANPQGGRLEYIEAGSGLRYVAIPSVCVASIILSGRPGRFRAVLTSLLLVAIVIDFAIAPRPNVGWAFESACIGGVEPCRVAIDRNGPDWGVIWPGLDGEYQQYPYPARFDP